MKILRFLLLVCTTAVASSAFAQSTAQGGHPNTGVPIMGLGPSDGGAVFARTDDAGAILVRIAADEIVVLPDGGLVAQGPQEVTGLHGGPVDISEVGGTGRLSATGGGDTLSVSSPDGGSAGYALSPGYLVMRIQVKDPAALSRTITQWVYDSNDNVWKPGGVLVTTPGVEEAFDLPMGVGDGRLYLQGDNPYGDGGALIKVNVTVQSVP